MIVTVTANPSIDRTIELSEPLKRGEVQVVAEQHEQAGGKGVNVARALHAAAVDVLAVVPCDASDPFLTELAELEASVANVPTGALVRTNVTVSEPDGTTTKLNAAGEPLTAAAVERLIAETARRAATAQWLVLAGSVPPGATEDLYPRLIAAVRARSAELGVPAPAVAVDTSGPALASVIRSAGTSGGVDLIKPNAHELAELAATLGYTDVPDGDALEADPELAARVAESLLPELGVAAMLLTLGAAGALLVTRDGSWAARPPRITPRSTVGAGDSSLAGYLVAVHAGQPPERAIGLAVAYGAAAASLAGSTVPRPDQTRPDLVEVTPLPRIVAGHQ
ncbi:1-phosphofructokinase [Labedella gwakjiensis]|uniref:1-phosphofructokinase n=1 Tax=Labedella gwakjiensis TaxID=390269 RepID=A0A2P8GTK8_9MICO|nr:1-phosphofructokinase family hexose kinase [Labedella gwakjiensis]PSL37294.1 1-phosphofructokinase [Labedella gwakjiensis]RUQ84620.1 1-phosphofructokinase family hexose kinase [Labedella gwakjiensis]